MTVAERDGHVARGRVTSDGIFENSELAVEHADVDFLAFSRPFAVEEGEHDAIGRKHPGDDITDRSAHTGWFAILRPRDAHDAAHRLHNDVVGRLEHVRTAVAEAGTGGIHDFGIDFFQFRVTNAELFHRSRPIVFEHDIGLFDHFAEQIDFLGALEVERNRALIAVQTHEVGAFLADERAESARIIADAGRFDLDDIRAEIGQHHRTVRARQNASQIKYLDSL